MMDGLDGGPAAVKLPAESITRELWCEAAVRERFSGGELLEQWAADHPDAAPGDRLEARKTILALQDLAQPATDSDLPGALRLPFGVRLQVFQQAGAQEALDRLSRHRPDQRTPAEKLLASLLAKDPVQPDMQDRHQLVTLSVLAPLATAAGAPPAFDVAGLPEQIRRLDLQHALGGPDLHRFVGRRKELSVLHRLWDGGNRECLVTVAGPGGIGKSLLVSRFIADLLANPDGQRPDAVFHIDFDRRDFQQALASTVLGEFARQAHLWVDHEAGRNLAELAQSAALSSIESAAQSRSYDEDVSARIAWTLTTALRARAGGKELSIVVFADSAERVIGFDDLAADSPWDAAVMLREYGARIFVIYGSRAFPSAWTDRKKVSRSFVISQLSSAEAAAYLSAELGYAGLSAEPAVLTAVMRSVGRSPLALRLAASILRKDGGRFKSSEWPHLLLASDERIQAVLYDRVLKRVRDPLLSKIAFPGLLVRRLTAPVIEQVLAEPCNIDLKRSRPETLMQLARSEIQLFVQDPSDPDPMALWHRQDVRAMMLDDLSSKVPPEAALAINTRAIAYYAQFDDPISRTEELYHRLRLNQPASGIRERWSDEAGARLVSSVREFPLDAQRLVRQLHGAASIANRVGWTSKMRKLFEAQRPDDEAMEDLRGIVGRLIQNGRDPAKQLRQHDADHLSSPVGDLYAESLLRAGRVPELVRGARDLRVAKKVPARVRLGVFCTAASALEGQGNLSEAVIFWTEASRCADADFKGNEITALGAFVGSLRIQRKLLIDGIPDRRGEVARVIEFARLCAGELAVRRVSLRESVAELSDALLEPDNPPSVEFLRHLAEILFRGADAFPSTISNPERLTEIGVALGADWARTPNELASSAMRLMYSGPERAIPLVRVLRSEVDWTLAQAVGARLRP